MTAPHTSQKPCLVFVHGGFCSHADWKPQSSELQDGYILVLPDLPGHGSAREEGDFSIATAATKMRAAQAAIGADEAVWIGHGLGCSVVLEAYRQDPREISGIILIEGHPLSPSVGANIPALDDAREARAKMKRMFASMLPASASLERREALLAHVDHFEDAFILTLLRALIAWRPTAEAIARSVQVPVEIIEAVRLDDGVFRALAENEHADWTLFLSSLVPHLTITQIPQGGHFLHLDCASEVNRLIDRFAKSILHPKS